MLAAAPVPLSTAPRYDIPGAVPRSQSAMSCGLRMSAVTANSLGGRGTVSSFSPASCGRRLPLQEFTALPDHTRFSHPSVPPREREKVSPIIVTNVLKHHLPVNWIISEIPPSPRPCPPIFELRSPILPSALYNSAQFLKQIAPSSVCKGSRSAFAFARKGDYGSSS